MERDPGTVGEVLSGAMAGTRGLGEEIALLAEQLRRLQTAGLAATESAASPSRVTGDAGSSGGFWGSTPLELIGTAGLIPLIASIGSLFGGGGDSPVPAPLVRFAPAPSIRAEGGMSENGGPAFAVDAAQGGLPRAVSPQAPAQITVQVQAMDSRSFLDHSNEIAMAVRQAMLESSVLNDVIREA